jgi:hypothetical protein
LLLSKPQPSSFSLAGQCSTKASELARSRTSDERKAMDLSRLLVHWMINGKPSREAKQKSLSEKPEIEPAQK